MVRLKPVYAAEETCEIGGLRVVNRSERHVVFECGQRH
jgi:hypothetical protein